MLIFWVLIFLIFAVDQIIKSLVLIYISPNRCVDTFAPFLKMVRSTNTGAAFSSFSGMRFFLIFISIMFIAFAFYYIFRNKIKDLKILVCASFMIGGAISNLFDRMFRGYVVDYLKIIFFPYICNLGDYFICIGATMVILLIVMRKIDL